MTHSYSELVNIITYSNQEMTNKNLLIFEGKTLDYLNSVSLEYKKDKFFSFIN